MITKQLEKIAALRRERQRSAINTYHEVLQALASDDAKSPSPEDVDAILTATGRTIGDLERDLKICSDRNSHRAKLAEFDAVKKDEEPTKLAIQKLEEGFAKLKKQHEEKLWPLRNKLSAIQNASSQSFNAEMALDQFIWPEFQAEREELSADVARLSEAKRKAEKHLQAMRSRQSTEDVHITGDAQKYGSRDEHDEHRKTLERYVSNAEHSFKQASAECDAAIQAQEEFIERMRKL